MLSGPLNWSGGSRPGLGHLTENQNVSVRILHFKFPAAIGLPAQGLDDGNLVLHRFVQFLHTFRANVRVPDPTAAPFIEIRLFVTFNPLEHDLDAVAKHDREEIWLGLRKGITMESELLFVPTYGGADIGDRKTRNNRGEIWRVHFCSAAASPPSGP